MLQDDRIGAPFNSEREWLVAVGAGVGVGGRGGVGSPRKQAGLLIQR